MPRVPPAHRDVALLDVPAWVWNRNPTKLLDAARLHHRGQRGAYRVRTLERYLGRPRPELIESATVLTSTGPGPGLRTLPALADDDVEAAIFSDAMARFGHQLKTEPSSLPDLVGHIQVTVGGARGKDLADQCAAVLKVFHETPFSDQPDERPFAQADVHYVRREEALLHRVKLASLLLRLEHDPVLAGGDTRHLQAELDAGGNIFAASAALYEGIHLLDPYLTPLLSALSPAVWAFAVHRAHGALIFTYGRPISGTAPAAGPGELLNTIRTDGGRIDPEPVTGAGRVYAPFSAPDVPGSAIHWWAEHLDTLFGVLADPATFTSTDSQYNPAAALQALLSVEQIFRRTTSAFLAHRDTHARRAAALTTLDTLVTLNGIQLERLFDHDHAVKTLANVTAEIPAAAGEILLPAATRAVDALARVQDGFFLRAPDGRVTIAGQPLAPAAAAAQYLVTLRNATHGFSTVRGTAKQRARNSDLLAVHNGEVPHDVGLLTWLYLLDLLVRPDRLRRVLRADCRR